MESLESCFFATSSDFVVCSVNRSRSPGVTVDRVAAAGTEDVPWVNTKTNCQSLHSTAYYLKFTQDYEIWSKLQQVKL